ncbi:MAG TPA: class I SAM-dependent methyltransferase [Methylomirabilota bacterium]|nr:class I SAM-dependent methyltransferase [Methylomirabilota bacterium]
MLPALKSLLIPFERGILSLPEGATAFLIRAEAAPELRDRVWRLTCEQTYKPAYDRLTELGLATTRHLEGEFAVGLCLLTKDKAENLVNLARAWSLVRPGGLLVFAGRNDVGAASIQRQAKPVVGEIGHLSKNHCRVWWSRRGDGPMPQQLSDWLAAGAERVVDGTVYVARPGIFSWRKVDEGSQLLASSLPGDMRGAVADVGAGWGYLAAALIERYPRIAALDLFEAEWLALEAARTNLEARPHPGIEVGYHWHDVTAGLPRSRYDWVVMNPPFHEDKGTDVDLGRRFIGAGIDALAPGGTLVLVANRHLPYEALLEARGLTARLLAQTKTFKVIEAKMRAS